MICWWLLDWLIIRQTALSWLDLIHPASPMHKATSWRQICLSRADASTSSQVNPILWRSLFTISLQFILRLPGLLLNPATSHCNACFRMLASSILVTLSTQSSFSDQFLKKCSVLFRISSSVTLSLQQSSILWTVQPKLLKNVLVKPKPVSSL